MVWRRASPCLPLSHFAVVFHGGHGSAPHLLGLLLARKTFTRMSRHDDLMDVTNHGGHCYSRLPLQPRLAFASMEPSEVNACAFMDAEAVLATVKSEESRASPAMPAPSTRTTTPALVHCLGDAALAVGDARPCMGTHPFAQLTRGVFMKSVFEACERWVLDSDANVFRYVCSSDI